MRHRFRVVAKYVAQPMLIEIVRVVPRRRGRLRLESSDLIHSLHR